MPVLLLILLVGVFAYFLWRHRTSTLTRHCRWRQDRAAGVWRCASCGASTRTPDGNPPKSCFRATI